jgi:dipeptidyl aminopeptidase
MRPKDYEPIPTEQEEEGEGEVIKETQVAESSSHVERTKTLDSRPPTYYGEGPFDPPSSEDESLLDDKEAEDRPLSPGRAEYGETGSRRSNAANTKKSTSLRALLYSLVALVSLAGVIGIIAGTAYSETIFRNSSFRKITVDHIFNGTFMVERYDVHWVSQAGDGVFSIRQDGYIKLVDLKSNSTSNLVAFDDVKDVHGRELSWGKWELSADMKYILIKADMKKQWRHSSFGNYYIHDIESKRTHPLIPPTDPPTTAYATWSPTGQSIAYVSNNDLYVLPVPTEYTDPIRITTSGNASLFHGVPDWVYEEEIFSRDYALWWSPDSSKVAFLRLDETLVDEYTFPIYNPTEDNDAVIPYTTDVVMKYPKPGYPNPLVSVHVFDLARFLTDAATLTLDWDGRQNPENSVILEVAWIDGSTLIVKEVNRNADDGSVVLFDLDAQESRSVGSVVRKLGKNGEEGDDGWIDNKQTIYPLPEGHSGYLDVIPTPEGYNHIALFSPASSNKPRFLTSGDWEVTSGIQAIDMARALVYFEAAWPSSTERHVYSVPLPRSPSEDILEPTALTDVKKASYYSSSFSPQAGFYLLSYLGPSTPWQRVVQVGNNSFEYVLTVNERLTNVTREFEAPTVVHSTITSDGYELNIKELRPPRMDDTGRTKYAVMFQVYGGPDSQMVDMAFKRDWSDYLVCGLQYIVVLVDGRGTGFKGRKLRNPVKGNIGYWETVDQINAARYVTSAGFFFSLCPFFVEMLI